MDEEDAVFRGFSLRALEKELSTAVEEEKKRHAVDEMKKRAIKTAASYDEFKNLVACAGQKPIERNGLTEITKTRRAGFGGGVVDAGGTAAASALLPTGAVSAGATSSALSPSDGMTVPKKPHAFRRDWRNLAAVPGGRFRYLRAIPAKRLGRLFAGDLEPTVLAEMIAAYGGELCGGAEAAEGEDEAALASRTATVKHMCAQLLAMAGLDRFDLARDLMTDGDKEQLAATLVAADRVVAGAGDAGDAVKDPLAGVRRAYVCAAGAAE